MFINNYIYLIISSGDRVGFGYVHDGCGECADCLAGRHYFCKVAPRNYGLTDHDQGSFATSAIWPDTLLHQIPENMDSAEAAPFMCAGQTVFTPMIRYGMKAGDCVGIIGIGGLGHLAIGFASKLGAEVAVFSSSENKKEEALSLGATEFWVTSELKTKKPEKKLDFLIITANTHPDWSAFLELMAPQSHIIVNQLTTDDMVIPFLPFILKEISIHSMLTATPEQVETMLHFAADHGVRPIIEQFPMTEEGIAQAVDKLSTGQIRYRGVLTASA
jgi:D-arabinose 1-dehydrogenase-like Zn-dependent alcohol dehydrogenase